MTPEPIGADVVHVDRDVVTSPALGRVIADIARQVIAPATTPDPVAQADAAITVTTPPIAPGGTGPVTVTCPSGHARGIITPTGDGWIFNQPDRWLLTTVGRTDSLSIAAVDGNTLYLGDLTDLTGDSPSAVIGGPFAGGGASTALALPFAGAPVTVQAFGPVNPSASPVALRLELILFRPATS